jgi:hypothetical protein
MYENEITANLVGAAAVLAVLTLGFFIGARLGWRYHLWRRQLKVRQNLPRDIVKLFNASVFTGRCPDCWVHPGQAAIHPHPGADVYSAQMMQLMHRRYGFRKKAELWRQYWQCPGCLHFSRVREEHTIGESQVNEAAVRFVAALEEASPLQLILEPDMELVDAIPQEEEE